MPSVVDLLNFTEQLLLRFGILIIPIGAFLENSVILGFVFPGVTLIFLSGFVARTTGADLGVIIALATVGALLGDNLDYFIGRKAGKILESKPLFARPVKKVEPYLMKYGLWAIFLGRFSGWSRAWIALACGVVGFSYLKFVIVSSISALIWTVGWVLGGYLLGGNRELIETWLNRGSFLVWIVLLFFIVYYFRTRIKLVLDVVKYASKKYGNSVKGKINGKSRI